MTTYILTFKLLSDATLSGGDGVAGLVNREVQQDALGLPYLRGRTLKGLLSEEADILVAHHPAKEALAKARHRLFGDPGCMNKGAVVHYSHATLPALVREAVQTALNQPQSEVTKEAILGSLTAVRRQTAISEENGLPEDGSLRAMRVVMRETAFEARLTTTADLTSLEEGLLAAAVMAWRRAGTGRNRGRGKLEADLLDAEGKSLLTSKLDDFMEGWE